MSDKDKDWTRTGRRVGIQLAYPFEEKRLAKWAPPYIVQPKLDGERCRIVIDDVGGVTLYSSEANVILSVPHINEAVERAAQAGLRNVELDGELYKHGLELDGENGIHAIVSRKVDLHPLFEEIEFHLFDLVSNATQTERLLELFRLPVIEFVNLVPYTVCDSFDQVMQKLDWASEKGFEGIIIRHLAASYVRRRSIYMMKFKPQREDIYTIIGFTQEISQAGVPYERLGALVCKAHENEETFNVGTGFDLRTREELWANRHSLPGNQVRVRYQHLTSLRGVPRSSVFVELL